VFAAPHVGVPLPSSAYTRSLHDEALTGGERPRYTDWPGITSSSGSKRRSGGFYIRHLRRRVA
jgi:hypothetical protein